MELSEFQKTITDIVASKGFKKKGSYYYLESPEVYVIINLQKSNYDNTDYYIGYGYIFKEIVDEPINLSFQHWHTQSRFCININGKDNKPINIKDVVRSKLINSLGKEIEQKITSYLTVESFKKKLEEEPELLYTIYIEAKKLFGLIKYNNL